MPYTAFFSFGICTKLWGVARFPKDYALERNVLLEPYRVFGTSGMGLGGRPMPVSVPARQRRKRSKPDRCWFGIKKPVRCCCRGQEGAWLGSRQVLVWGQKESLAGWVLASDSKAVRAKSWLVLRTRRSSSAMLLVLAAFCLSVSRMVCLFWSRLVMG